MPTAENGEFSIQSSIALWVGATHWSNPYPVKFPGVTRLSAWAGAANENEVSIALQIAADNRAMRGRIRDSKGEGRSEEHTSELQSLMRISYAVFCLKKKKNNKR